MKKLICFALSLMLISIPITSQAMEMDRYTVQKDDTLWIIAGKYKISLEDIVWANPQLEDPNLIYPDEVVNVPLKQANEDLGVIGASTYYGGDESLNLDNVNTGSQQDTKSKAPANDYENQVLVLVNQERSKNGLASLVLAKDVSNVARVKSEDMRDKRYFNHTSPTYGSPFEMLKQFGITYKSAGENIAKGQRTPDSVMNAWMNSEGHRKNILNPNFKEIGIGYVIDGSGTAYWTQQFVTR